MDSVPGAVDTALVGVEQLLEQAAVTSLVSLARSRSQNPHHLCLAVPGLCHTHHPHPGLEPACAYCARRGNAMMPDPMDLELDLPGPGPDPGPLGAAADLDDSYARPGAELLAKFAAEAVAVAGATVAEAATVAPAPDAVLHFRRSFAELLFGFGNELLDAAELGGSVEHARAQLASLKLDALEGCSPGSDGRMPSPSAAAGGSASAGGSAAAAAGGASAAASPAATGLQHLQHTWQSGAPAGA